MKKYLKGLFTVAVATVAVVGMSSCSPREAASVSSYDVIPQPHEVTLLDQKAPFVLDRSVEILYGPEVNVRDAEFLADYIEEATEITLSRPTLFDPTKVPACAPIIVLGIEENPAQPEGYTLSVDSLRVRITGGSADGLFYGIQTLRKSLPVGEFSSVELPAVEITDYPRFGYRGMHLDIARHFQDVDFIKKYIDILALHNMNTFHWHLVDDQGWRVEIKKYP
ncbi:MAG: family 20 glycosylhydrolase, partial [Tidjanibacter sp.]|nr:family 20 glycosylhydrolase [Tidjanibacter sp.]